MVSDEDVVWFDVPINDPMVVRECQRLSGANHDREVFEGLLERARIVEELGERATANRRSMAQ